jgi:hypothetical protein
MQVGLARVDARALRDLRPAGAGHPGSGREGGVHSPELRTEPTNACIKR